MLAHLHDAPPRPTLVAADVPAGFDRVIARALGKDPDARYPSGGDLGRAALAAAEGRHVTESERTVHQPRQTMPLGDRPRRHRGRRAARVLAVLAGLALAVFAVAQIAG